MEYYLTIKSFSVLTDDTIWMYLENMLNERRQNGILHDFIYLKVPTGTPIEKVYSWLPRFEAWGWSMGIGG